MGIALSRKKIRRCQYQEVDSKKRFMLLEFNIYKLTFIHAINRLE